MCYHRLHQSFSPWLDWTPRSFPLYSHLYSKWPSTSNPASLSLSPSTLHPLRPVRMKKFGFRSIQLYLVAPKNTCLHIICMYSNVNAHSFAWTYRRHYKITNPASLTVGCSSTFQSPNMGPTKISLSRPMPSQTFGIKEETTRTSIHINFYHILSIFLFLMYALYFPNHISITGYVCNL